MRFLSVVLAVSLWLGPVVQAYATTLSEAHCRPEGHMSMTAPDAVHDDVHAAHHGQGSVDTPDTSSAHHEHGSSHAEQCKCGCLCGHVGVASAAISSSFFFTDPPLPNRFDVVRQTGRPHAEHSVPQRPPAVLS